MGPGSLGTPQKENFVGYCSQHMKGVAPAQIFQGNPNTTSLAVGRRHGGFSCIEEKKYQIENLEWRECMYFFSLCIVLYNVV